MESLLTRLVIAYPQLSFTPGKIFCWSPKKREIQYVPGVDDAGAQYALLHEVGHALLDHKNYTGDFELLSMEVAAWEKAKHIAPSYDVAIDEDHIQDSLDSYRDWLYQRSVCPTCSTKSLQQDTKPLYRCHNCHATWEVATSRFCRPYRQARPTDKATTTGT